MSTRTPPEIHLLLDQAKHLIRESVLPSKILRFCCSSFVYMRKSAIVLCWLEYIPCSTEAHHSSTERSLLAGMRSVHPTHELDGPNLLANGQQRQRYVAVLGPWTLKTHKGLQGQFNLAIYQQLESLLEQGLGEQFVLSFSKHLPNIFCVEYLSRQTFSVLKGIF